MRYSRQEKFIGKKAQNILSKKTIAVVGLGALGSNSSNLLARAGINLILIDYDKINLTNLQRQNIFTEEDIGKYKTEIIERYLNKVNSKIKIKSYNKKINKENINLIKSDLILDCTDNLEIRFLINEFCFKNNIPFVHAGAIQDKGVIFNVIPGKICFNCIYKFTGEIERCEDFGVLNTITTLISSLQVNEALKILLNKNYENNLLRINLSNNTFDKIRVNKNLKCEICNNKKIEKDFELTLCKTGKNLIVKSNKKLDLDKIRNKFGFLREDKFSILIEIDNEEIIINNYEILFKTLKDENKILKIAKRICAIRMV
jgi:adenylyltransferase/sulfurtransferase